MFRHDVKSYVRGYDVCLASKTILKPSLETFEMAVTRFSLQDKLGKVQFWKCLFPPSVVRVADLEREIRLEEIHSCKGHAQNQAGKAH